MDETLDTAPDYEFCRRLPKVELHAHLSGSVSPYTLQSLYDCLPATDPARELEPPNAVFANGKRAGQSIHTFFRLFNNYTYRLISSSSALRTVTRSVLDDFSNDGVKYLELRTTPRALSNTVSARDAVLAVLEEIERQNNRATVTIPERAGVVRTDEGMRVSLLLSIDRSKHSYQAATEIVDLALELRKVGHPVFGVDLSGDPTSTASVTQFAPAFRRAREGGLKLALHFAELPPSSTDAELEELMSWKPRRLGHCLYVKPEMRREIAAREGDETIGVEQCISCNVLAGMLPTNEIGREATIKDHPFKLWLRDGAEVSICTDDFGVFQSPSSREHFLASKAAELTRMDLINISLRAMDGAFCDEEERRRVLSLIRHFAVEEQSASAIAT